MTPALCAAAMAARCALPSLALAQASMPGMDMGSASAGRSPAQASPPPARMAGMDMAGMDMGRMQGALGAYPMTRDASGTAWQPDSSPMQGVHGQAAGWSTMLHGYATLVYDNQGGRRGDEKTFAESMLMGIAKRPLGGGTLTLLGMFSLDPLMGKSGIRCCCRPARPRTASSG